MAIGDSHLRALWPALRDDSVAHPVLVLGGAGCPYLRDVRAWFATSPSSRADCPILVAQASAALQRERVTVLDRAVAPDTTELVVTVLLHARMALYFERAGVGQEERAVRQASNSFVQEPWLTVDATADTLARAIQRDLEWYVRDGHRVVLLLQVPELGFDVRQCVRLRPYERFVSRTLPDCTVSRAEVVERQRRYREAVRAAVSSVNSPLVRVVDPLNVFCDLERCRAVRDGVLLYRDQDHLSDAGARYLWSALRPLDEPR